MYGLVRLAGLEAGERVLIHAAAGGVGMAAVQLAGASAPKCSPLPAPTGQARLAALAGRGARFRFARHCVRRRAYSQLTGGTGVDVVLNSLAGEFIPASVVRWPRRTLPRARQARHLDPPSSSGSCAPMSRYQRLRSRRGGAGRSGLLLRPLLDELLAGLSDGSLRPLPVRVFEFAAGRGRIPSDGAGAPRGQDRAARRAGDRRAPHPWSAPRRPTGLRADSALSGCTPPVGWSAAAPATSCSPDAVAPANRRGR